METEPAYQEIDIQNGSLKHSHLYSGKMFSM